MAHELSDLLTKADEDQGSRDAARKLTLDLWERRNSWPAGWLPPGLSTQLRWLSGPAASASLAADRIMQQVVQSLRREYGLWMLAVGHPEADSSAVTDFSQWEAAEVQRGLALIERIEQEARKEGAAETSPTSDWIATSLDSVVESRRSLLQQAIGVASSTERSDG